MTDPHHEFPVFSYANHVLARRSGIRQALAMPADELDDSVGTLGFAPFHDEDDLTDQPAGPVSPREVRVLFWPRTELTSAHHLWPQLIQHTDADAIIRDREHPTVSCSKRASAGSPWWR
jgi:hypothetical protein